MEKAELELVGRHVLKSYMQMKFLGIYITEAGMSIAKSFTHLELAVQRLILIISAISKSVNTSGLLFFCFFRKTKNSNKP